MNAPNLRLQGNHSGAGAERPGFPSRNSARGCRVRDQRRHGNRQGCPPRLCQCDGRISGPWSATIIGEVGNHAFCCYGCRRANSAQFARVPCRFEDNIVGNRQGGRRRRQARTCGNRGTQFDIRSASRSTTSALHNAFEEYTIESDKFMYLSRERLRSKRSKPALLTIDGPVKFHVEGRKLVILDNEGKEHETRQRSSLQPRHCQAHQQWPPLRTQPPRPRNGLVAIQCPVSSRSVSRWSV